MERIIFIFTVLIFVIGLTLGIANAVDITSGLVGYWPLDGNAKDTIGGKDGKLQGGAKWTKNGYIKDAVEIDGSTGFVEVSGFKLSTDTITIVAWILGWRQSAWTGIVASRGGTNDTWMGFTDQDTLSYVWNNDSDQTWGWRKGPKLPKDLWAMAAVAIEPKKATAYIYSDGKLNFEANAIAHIKQTIDGRLTFGWDSCCGDNVRHFLGIIDEVMIYNRAMNNDEILKLAQSGLAVVAPAGKLTTTWAKIKTH